MFTALVIGALAGLVSTYAMDIGAKLGRKAGLIGGFDPRLLGRWILRLSNGKLSRENNELRVAIVSHYLIGAGLGALFFLAYQGLPIRHGEILAGLGFGILSNVLPWFVMFPSLGFGFFGLNGPAGARLFRTSFYNHVVYGLALGSCGWLIDCCR